MAKFESEKQSNSGAASKSFSCKFINYLKNPETSGARSHESTKRQLQDRTKDITIFRYYVKKKRFLLTDCNELGLKDILFALRNKDIEVSVFIYFTHRTGFKKTHAHFEL